MAYCTEAEIINQIPEEELIQFADDDGDEVADTGVIEKAISDADAEIDGYLSGRYTLPFSTVPPILNKLSVDIAIWNLYSRRTVPNEMREKRYNAAVAMLKLMAKGEVKLGVTPEPTGAEQNIKASRETSDRIFTTGKPSADETGSLDNY